MGVASGMPCDADLLALLPRCAPPARVADHADRPPGDLAGAPATAELGGMLRSGLEDTFYLPGGGPGRLRARAARQRRR
jgi:3-keto-5-aminohexanoate cleavage enzyme